jgi:hypothetical protein
MRSRALPSWMRASAQVDLAQLCCSIRPVIRSQVAGKPSYAEVRRWARRAGLYVAMDDGGFFSMSREPSAARRALRIDAGPGRHTIALGRALGYPLCCCVAAGRRQEEGLDAWANEMSSRRFAGKFRLIRPAGYLTGQSYISHVPCSPCCLPSLRMAQALECRHRSCGTWPRSCGAVREAIVRSRTQRCV